MRPEGCGQSLQRRIEGFQHVRSHTAVARHSFTRLTNSCNAVLQTCNENVQMQCCGGSDLFMCVKLAFNEEKETL